MWKKTFIAVVVIVLMTGSQVGAANIGGSNSDRGWTVFYSSTGILGWQVCHWYKYYPIPGSSSTERVDKITKGWLLFGGCRAPRG